MVVERERSLFENLAEQAAPERASGAGPRLRMAERRQVEARMLALDDLISERHRVRQVWRFVEGLDVTALHGSIKAVEGHAGHPPADPRIIMALWLYATIEGVGSARQLARLCEEHFAYQWLCGGVGVNAKTLADFRVDHGAALEQLLVDSFAALLKVGVARLDRVAQDGVRVRAAAGAASFRRHSTLETCRVQAEAAVRQLRAQAEHDPAAASRQQGAARRRSAEDRERRVAEALAVTRKLREVQQERERRRAEHALEEDRERAAGEVASQAMPTSETKPEKEPRASTTDAQARIMKMADGGFRPAYNVQFIGDTLSGAVAGVSVDNIGSDMGKMAPMNDALAAHYGKRPSEHLADGGYARLNDIEALDAAGVTAYVPVPAPRDKARDRHAAQPADAPAVAAWRERMGTETAKAIYKQRAATAECVNAQARNRGLRQFLVRGIDKVRAIATWHALAHNMACTWRLVKA